MMNITKNNWKLQSLPFDKEIKEALEYQHHAAQFIAMVGRHLIPEKPDDSNTNMEYIPEGNLLLGNEMPNGIRVALQLTELKLYILDSHGNTKKLISLEGKTQNNVFVELSQNLADLGVDITNFKNELHYDIPSHPVNMGAEFLIKNKNAFIENSNYRNNAKIVLNEIAKVFKQDEPIRIWPHHFDTGAFYVIKKNEKEEMTQTMGIGFAIPDSMIDEPYYYLSFWSANPVEGLEKLPALEEGNWMMPDWNGAVLKHTDIIEAGSADKQHELVKMFYESGIKLLMDIL